MALYGPVEARSLSARLFHGVVYLILIIGSVSMVYPFLLMLGASVTTDLDFEQWQIVPAYLTSDVALFRKWMDDRYGDDFYLARQIHDLKVGSFRFLDAIPALKTTPRVEQRVHDWLECVRELPDDFKTAFYRDMRLTRPTHRRFCRWAYDRYKGNIAAFNAKFKTAYTRFEEIAVVENPLSHKMRRDTSPFRREYLEFRKTLPPEDLSVFLATDGFMSHLERTIGPVSAFNKYLASDLIPPLKGVRGMFPGETAQAPVLARNIPLTPFKGGTGPPFTAYRDVIFPINRPADDPWRALWDAYVVKHFPLMMLRVEGDFTEKYRNFLAKEHKNYDKHVADYNAANETNFPPLADVRYPSSIPEDDLNFADWANFTDTEVPNEAKRLVTVEGIYRDFLRKQYPSLEALNAAQGTAFADWSLIMPPRAETDLVTFWKNRSAIRKEFLLRNYSIVLNYMLFHGEAGINTLILVIMMVFGQLTVQPLAAYGLSRFQLRYAHKVLLFLLATMAFPAEVAMIPNFLMIKELGLLNTYWALVLPGLASGMGIFLLKGYFDSLPKELYEAAMIDGAGELRMFFQITLPLSMPILAVIALASFGAAYGGFMWAFLICQNPKMWTLMVFLWQLGSDSYPSVWMASLVLAAIPTLLVFIFCQRIILRGIIVPTMK